MLPVLLESGILSTTQLTDGMMVVQVESRKWEVGYVQSGLTCFEILM